MNVAGLCQVCGEPASRMHTCKLCGKVVCNKCATAEDICLVCLGKRLPESIKR